MEQTRIVITNLLPRHRTFDLADRTSVRIKSGSSVTILEHQLSNELREASLQGIVLLEAISLEEPKEETNSKTKGVSK